MKAEDHRQFGGARVQLRNGTAVTVRPLAPDDAEALGDFYESVPPEDNRFYCPHPLTRPWARKIADDADDPFFICLVMEDGHGRIVGYAWTRRTDETSDRSNFGICIRRGFQGAGAGQALMTRLLEIARHSGPPVIGLTVQVANTSALALYEKMGFRIVRRQLRASDDEPEYYMELDLR